MNILENLTKEQIVEKFGKGIDAPYIHVGRAALGGQPIVTVCLKHIEDWANGIMQNEVYGYFNIEENGTIENWARFSNKLRKMRKFTAKNLDDAINRINLHVQIAKKELM